MPKEYLEVLKKEILKGDVLKFTALVKTYAIHRDDISTKRDIGYKEERRGEQRKYREYRERYLDWQEKKASIDEENAQLYHYVELGQMSTADYIAIKKQNNDRYLEERPIFKSDGIRGRKEYNKAIATQSALNMRDFQLVKLNDVKVKMTRPKRGWTREKIDFKRLSDHGYLKYLVARSSSYAKNLPYDKF